MTAPGMLRRIASYALVGLIATLAPAAPGADPVGADGVTPLVSRPSGDLSQADQPALSADGTVLAYVATTTPGTFAAGSRIARRELPDGPPVMVSDPTRAATEPSLSADGRLLAYALDKVVDEGGWVGLGTAGPDARLAVTRFSGGQPVTRVVSGLPSDPALLRLWSCQWPGIRDYGSCGARLSADGRTLVYPAQLSVESPALELSSDFTPDNTAMFGRAYLPALDFGPDPRQPPYGQVIARTLRVRVTGPEPVQFGQPVVDSENPGSFQLTAGEYASACAGARVAPGQECLVRAEFHRSSSCGPTRFGTLRLESPTPAGRTLVALIGDEARGCPAGPVCASDPGSGSPPTGTPGTGNDGPARRVSLGFLLGEAGRSTSNTIVNLSSGPAEVRFDALSAGVSLNTVTPPPGGPTTPTTTPAVCRPGMVLAAGQSCLAEMAITGAEAGPRAASLTLLDAQCRPLAYTRILAAVSEAVIVVRRDSAGDGGFDAPGGPAPVLLRQDDTGRPVPAFDPAVSGDGRYLAYTTAARGPAPTRIVVHDTDLRGDRGYLPGATVPVSLTDGNAALPSARRPSLSGDGRRVAFEVPGTENSPGQVYVRDLAAGRTLLASGTPDRGTSGAGTSSGPVITADGRAVAFVTSAGDIIDQPAEVFPVAAVRELPLDAAAPMPDPAEMVSLAPERPARTSSARMATSADGAMVAFLTTDVLDTTAEGQQAYLRVRSPRLAVDPPALVAPPAALGQPSAPLTFTVTNTGPGPARLRFATNGPVTVSGCGTGILHRRESCTGTLVLTPTVLGPQRAAVTVTVPSPFGSLGAPITVPVTGLGVPPALRVEPATLRFDGQSVGRRSAPATLLVRNVGNVPLTVTAVAGPGPAGLRLDDAAPSSCAGLAARAVCRFAVTVTPATAQSVTGTVILSGLDSLGARHAMSVPVEVVVTPPRVAVAPLVSRPGRAVTVDLTGFPPGAGVVLTWRPGIDPERAVTIDANGTARVSMPLLRTDVLGSRVLVAKAGALGEFPSTDPVLVVLGTLQPPEFVARR